MYLNVATDATMSVPSRVVLSTYIPDLLEASLSIILQEVNSYWQKSRSHKKCCYFRGFPHNLMSLAVGFRPAVISMFKNIYMHTYVYIIYISDGEGVTLSGKNITGTPITGKSPKFYPVSKKSPCFGRGVLFLPQYIDLEN